MMILGLALFAIGYAVAYWAMTILWDAYTQTTSPMNPPPLAVCLAIPGSGADQSLQGTGTPTPNQPAMKGPGE